MKVSNDLDYWEGRTAIFYVNGVTGMKMQYVALFNPLASSAVEDISLLALSLVPE